MKFIRKDNKINKYLYLFFIALGVGLILLGVLKANWLWNIIVVVVGLAVSLGGYKKYKKTGAEIQEFEFDGENLKIKRLNGTEQLVNNKRLRYSLLVKKYYKPIRAIEFIEKRSIGALRGKSLGILHVSKWENDMELIAKHLVKSGFERKRWKFGWSIGDFLMIFSIILGVTEAEVEGYIGNVEPGLSESVGDIGEAISEVREERINESIKSEREHLRSDND